jgi:23S rRNA (adenine2503-C2)-methyltransferase
MVDLRALTSAELAEFCAGQGWESYRARQLYAWLWQKGVDNLASMTDLSKAARARLAETCRISRLEPVRTATDADGTAKYAFRLEDGLEVESVFIPDGDRRTACVSTQVGCGLGCEFCRTGRLGLARNLRWHEIVLQVVAIRNQLRTRDSSPDTHHSQPITNVVFMGMGEPLLNYDAVEQAIRVMNDEDGLGIGARHITVSTAGIPAGIRRYALLPLQTKLALSLNATDDQTRSRLMPVNRRHPLKEVMIAVREYAAAKGKRVTFEYVLVAGVNDRPADVDRLAQLVRGIPCKLNLIPLNPFPGCDLRPPSPAEVDAFAHRLWPLVPAVTVRRSKGTSILAACGQLAGPG